MQKHTYPSLPTPQVLLSLDLVDSLQFFEGSRARRPGYENNNVSDFIDKFVDKLCFIFTSNQKGNLINFRSSWGREESGQSSFRMEILDAGGEFEKTFFGHFSTGGVSYAQAMLHFVANKDKNLKRYTNEQSDARFDAVTTGKAQQGVVQNSMADLDKFVDDRVQAEMLAAKERGDIKYRVQEQETVYEGRSPGFEFDPETGAQRRLPGPAYSRAAYNRDLKAWKGRSFFGSTAAGQAPQLHVAGRVNTSKAQFSATQKQLNNHILNNKNSDIHWEVIGWDVAGHSNINNAEDYKNYLRRTYLAEYEKLFLFEEGFDDSYYDLSQEIRRLGGLPFTQKFWISFGVGDDISTYAPAQLANLVKIEYGLNANDVRTFVLHFVPTPGLLSVEANPHMLNAIRGADRVQYQVKETLVDKKGNARSPLSAVESIVEKIHAMVMGTDTRVFCLTFDIEEGVRKKFNECIASTLYQQLKPQFPNTKLTSEKLTEWGGFEKLSKYLAESSFAEVGDVRFLTGVSYNVSRFDNPNDDLTALLVNVEKEAHQQFTLDTWGRGIEGPSPPVVSGFRNSFDTFSFYLKVLRMFFTELGFQFKASFYNTKNVKVQWFPFAKSLDGSINTLNAGKNLKKLTKREFVFEAMQYFIVEIGMVANTPLELKRGIDGAIAQLDSQGKPPLTLNYSETAFLHAWERQTNRNNPRQVPPNVVFIINRGLWGALVKGKGHDHINSKLNNLPNWQKDKLTWFVNAYNQVIQSDSPVGDVPGLFNPYSYLSAENRQLNGKSFMSTFDALGKFESPDAYENYLRSNRIPLFNYGFTNSNILDFNFDLNMWWAQFLRIVPESLKNVLLTASIGDPKQGFTNHAFKTAVDLAQSDLSGEKLEEFLNKLYDEAADDFLHDTGMDATVARENEVFKFNAISRIAVNSPTVTPRQIQNAYAISDPEERKAAKTAIFPTKEEFKQRMKQCILLILNTSDYAAKFISQTWNDNNSLEDLLSIQDRMATQGGFRGTITTLPLFQIMTPTMVGRTALLHFVEPQIQSNAKLNNEIPFKTWLSGEYFILGYEATIADGEITSKFDILKKPYLKNTSIIE